MFIVSEFETLQFCEHFQAYEVETPLQRITRVVNSRDFSCFLPLHQAKTFGNRTRYVSLRYETEMALGIV